MTAAELRALIAGATNGALVISNGFVGSRNVKFAESVDGGDGYRLKTDGDTELWVALRNHAERFAELLAAEEAKAEPKREWTSCRPCDGWDYRVDGVYAGQVWPSSSGEWWWCLRDNLDNGIEPTQLLARAAVEAAVRAGR